MAKKKEELLKEEPKELMPEASEKVKLEVRLKELESLYEFLKVEGIRSISDIENKIAKARVELSKL